MPKSTAATTPTKEKKKSSSKKTKTSSSSKDERSSSPTKEKKKKRSSSSSSRKSSKSPGRSSRKSRESRDKMATPRSSEPVPPSPPPPPQIPLDTADQDPKASSDFEAGLLFQRFACNGGVSAKDFQAIWREREKASAGGGRSSERETPRLPDSGRRESDRARREHFGQPGGDNKFEFGQLFHKYDTDGDGRLGRADFERMIGGMLDELGRARGARSGGVGDGERVKAAETRGGSGDGVAAEGLVAGFPRPPPVPDVYPAVAGEAVSSKAISGIASVSHYDETTGVPLTRESVASQQSLGHTVVLLSEAYNRRLSRLQTLASSRLMPVREQLLQLRRRFHNRAEEVRAAKAAVERETRADAEAIVERLRSVEALKQATLAQRVNEATAELEGVEKIVEQVSAVTALSSTAGFASTSANYTNNFEGAEKMVELIQSYPELCGSIDRVASKPFNADVHVRADDFPHETAERLEVLRRADRYEQALSVKDQMLWTATQESRELDERCQQERSLGQDFAEEAQEWVALAGRLSDDVNKLKREVAQTTKLREDNFRLLGENDRLVRRIQALEGKCLTGDEGQRAAHDTRWAPTDGA